MGVLHAFTCNSHVTLKNSQQANHDVFPSLCSSKYIITCIVSPLSDSWTIRIHILYFSSIKFTETTIFCCPNRAMGGKIMFKFSSEQTLSSKLMTKHVLPGLAASLIFLSQTNQVSKHDTVCASIEWFEFWCRVPNFKWSPIFASLLGM